MKIGLRSHTGAEDRLLFAQQIKVQGASIWAKAIPEYEERCYLNTEDVRTMRARFDKQVEELELSCGLSTVPGILRFTDNNVHPDKIGLRAEASGIFAQTVPSAGFTLSKVRPSSASVRLPSM